METIQIRLPKNQIKLIDRGVRHGMHKSRSDAIRYALERMRFLSLLDDLGDILRGEGVTREEALRELKQIRREVYKKYL